MAKKEKREQKRGSALETSAETGIKNSYKNKVRAFPLLSTCKHPKLTFRHAYTHAHTDTKKSQKKKKKKMTYHQKPKKKMYTMGNIFYCFGLCMPPQMAIYHLYIDSEKKRSESWLPSPDPHPTPVKAPRGRRKRAGIHICTCWHGVIDQHRCTKMDVNIFIYITLRGSMYKA